MNTHLQPSPQCDSNGGANIPRSCTGTGVTYWLRVGVVSKQHLSNVLLSRELFTILQNSNNGIEQRDGAFNFVSSVDYVRRQQEAAVHCLLGGRHRKPGEGTLVSAAKPVPGAEWPKISRVAGCAGIPNP